MKKKLVKYFQIVRCLLKKTDDKIQNIIKEIKNKEKFDYLGLILNGFFIGLFLYKNFKFGKKRKV